MKLGKESSKYVILEDNIQLLDLDTTVNFHREGFECTIDIMGKTWNGKFETDGSLKWDNGSVWVRDSEFDEKEEDSPEEREAKFQAKMQKERETKLRKKKHEETVAKINDAMSKVPELRTLPGPPL